MRGDQLARQWRVIRVIEASPNGLTVTEIARREKIGICTIYHDLQALQAVRVSQHAQRAQRANRWVFTDTLKFKFLLSFSSPKLRSFVFTSFPTEGLRGIPSYDSWIR